MTAAARREDYLEALLALVEQIPPGRVSTYGALADALADEFGGGPRQVGSAMARHGAPVPWWRVVRADGSLPMSHQGKARTHYRAEGTPMRASGSVDIRNALWLPANPSAPGDSPGRAGL